MLRTFIIAALAITGATRPVAAQEVITLPARDRALQARTKTIFTVGREDGTTPDVFGNVSSVAFDGEGNLYVLDGLAKRVVVFDGAGKYVRDFGRDGRGPGELSRPSSIAITANGLVVVRDGAARGFHLFERDGRYLRTVPQSAELPGPVGPMRVHPNGVVTEAIQAVFGERRRELDYIPLLLHPLADNARGTQLFAIPAPKPEVRTQGNAVMSIDFRRKLYEMQPTWTVLASGALAVAHEPVYEVKLTTPAGRVERLLRRDIAARKWTARDDKAARAKERESLQNGGVRTISSGGASQPVRLAEAEVDRRMAELEFTDIVAPIRRIAADDAGRIWIQRSGAVVTENGPVDVIGADLRYIGTLPPQELPAAFGPGGRAAYIVNDELGVSRVVVRELSGF